MLRKPIPVNNDDSLGLEELFREEDMTEETFGLNELFKEPEQAHKTNERLQSDIYVFCVSLLDMLPLADGCLDEESIRKICALLDIDLEETIATPEQTVKAKLEWDLDSCSAKNLTQQGLFACLPNQRLSSIAADSKISNRESEVKLEDMIYPYGSLLPATESDSDSYIALSSDASDSDSEPLLYRQLF
jgi:hypothetical protein